MWSKLFPEYLHLFGCQVRYSIRHQATLSFFYTVSPQAQLAQWKLYRVTEIKLLKSGNKRKPVILSPISYFSNVSGQIQLGRGQAPAPMPPRQRLHAQRRVLTTGHGEWAVPSDAVGNEI